MKTSNKLLLALLAFIFVLVTAVVIGAEHFVTIID
ncbi:hypothetical protein ADICEAN_03642 [Cesiribacter andamanensis AMV16]|uniref:Uncharacterized protein n=1 Tax=Cesiribacter andamanensis AMV16 TaxID=1279009 RepID=M7MXR6_9BACT|nr:hypothetical protein ADICEAN_03642 [Cesiribacter andamanensis AMV16]